MFIVDRSMACSVTCEWTELSDSVPFYCKTTAKYLQFAVFSTIAPIEALKVKHKKNFFNFCVLSVVKDRLSS